MTVSSAKVLSSPSLIGLIIALLDVLLKGTQETHLAPREASFEPVLHVLYLYARVSDFKSTWTPQSANGVVCVLLRGARLSHK